MKPLSEDEVTNFLSVHLKKWNLIDGAIRRDFEFSNFVEAFSFMTAVALEAEKMDHHPDWKNSYNKVSISLSTHSAEGITQNDFDLANKIDSLYKSHK
jgi:4a-hydroxytetrahydrobiopterin dehydratase